MKKRYRIRDAAEELGLHENTIRRLEQRGLIKPERSTAGHRIFDEETIEKIRKIYHGDRHGAK
jgi:DNA-binding transcriptional MerR regulator